MLRRLELTSSEKSWLRGSIEDIHKIMSCIDSVCPWINCSTRKARSHQMNLVCSKYKLAKQKLVSN